SYATIRLHYDFRYVIINCYSWCSWFNVVKSQVKCVIVFNLTFIPGFFFVNLYAFFQVLDSDVSTLSILRLNKVIEIYSISPQILPVFPVTYRQIILSLHLIFEYKSYLYLLYVLLLIKTQRTQLFSLK